MPLFGSFYVSKRYICFYSKIFTRKTQITLPFRDISSISKRFGQIPVPNAIRIDMLDNTTSYWFRWFYSTEDVYDLLQKNWIDSTKSKSEKNEISDSQERNRKNSLLDSMRKRANSNSNTPAMLLNSSESNQISASSNLQASNNSTNHPPNLNLSSHKRNNDTVAYRARRSTWWDPAFLFHSQFNNQASQEGLVIKCKLASNPVEIVVKNKSATTVGDVVKQILTQSKIDEPITNYNVYLKKGLSRVRLDETKLLSEYNNMSNQCVWKLRRIVSIELPDPTLLPFG